MFWSRRLELVEFLHPGQENVHLSEGFGLSCFYVQLEGKKSCSSAVSATSIGVLPPHHAQNWLTPRHRRHLLWDGL